MVNKNSKSQRGRHDHHIFAAIEAAKNEVLKAVRSVGRRTSQILKELKTMGQEIDDLNAKFDTQTEALGTFKTTLDSGVAAIQKEIKQLADKVQAATDLDTLKQQVVAATSRVQGTTDAINSASVTLQEQIDALAADDEAEAGTAARKGKK